MQPMIRTVLRAAGAWCAAWGTRLRAPGTSAARRSAPGVRRFAVCSVLLCSLCSCPPSASVRRENRKLSSAARRPPKRPRPHPRIVAVDRRIANRVNHLRPCVRARLLRVLRKLPRRVTLLVTSAHRTRAEQAALRSDFGIKAIPGKSAHEDGRAIDVNVLVDGKRVSPRKNQKIIGRLMASEGFRHPFPHDPVHYSVPKEALDPTRSRGPRLRILTMGEMLALRKRSLKSGRVRTVRSVEKKRETATGARPPRGRTARRSETKLTRHQPSGTRPKRSRKVALVPADRKQPATGKKRTKAAYPAGKAAGDRRQASIPRSKRRDPQSPGSSSARPGGRTSRSGLLASARK
jgi:hypothetical protein